MFYNRNISLNILNILVAFYPLAFAMGNFIINSFTLIICILGIFLFKKDVLKFDFKEYFLIIFFFILIFSTTLNYLNLKITNFDIVIKSILFLRYLLLYQIMSVLIQNKKFNINLFLNINLIIIFLICLDIIFQYNFGFNLMGNYKLLSESHASGIFGKELIAGGFIVRFSFFAFIALIIIFPDIKSHKFKIIFLNILFTFAILFSGNKISILIYILGLITLIIINKKYRTIFLKNFIASFIIIVILFYFNKKIELQINRLISGSKQIIFSIFLSNENNINKKDIIKKIDSDSDKKIDNHGLVGGSHHYAIFLTAIDTSKSVIIIGGGLKNFDRECKKFYLNKNRNCSNHPHNYYLEIINDTGVMGLIMFLSYLILFFINNKKVNYNKSINKFFLVILFMELFPFKSTGSFFSTGNATYIFLILPMIGNLEHIKEVKIFNFNKIKKIFNL